jgi:transposase
MATRQFELSETQIKELKRQEQQTRRVSELKRLQAVRFYGSGRKLKDIMDIVGCGESSVRIWAMTYAREGLGGLLSGYDGSSQNARKLSPAQEAQLRERLHSYRPDAVLPLETCQGREQFWTVETVKDVVETWYGVSYAYSGSYRNLLHRCGFSYQRSEQVYKSRPSAVEVADFEAELEKK